MDTRNGEITMDNEYTLHDITEEQLLKICLNSEFPGSQNMNQIILFGNVE